MAAPLRGLPPPAAMTLPSPTQSSSLGQLPDRWQQGSEETQRFWFQAKMEEERRRQEEERRRQEEERRKQEEERTKQEHIRLDVRRTELEMLREAMRGGMPPQLVPVIFTGGGAMAGSSAEWASQYVAEMHRNQQHIQQAVVAQEQALSPHLRRGSRLIAATEHQTPLQTPQQTPISGGPRAPPPPPPSGNPPPPPPSLPTGSYTFAASTAASRPPQHQPHQQQSQPGTPMRAALPSINTSDIKIHPPPQNQPGVPMQLQPMQQQQNPSSAIATGQPPAPHQAQPTTEGQRHTESSPSIFFHHWQPPASTQPASGSAQTTSTASPPGKQLDSPFSQRGESGNSPKKRKAANISQTSQPNQYQPQQLAPTPQGTTGQITFSPPFSSGGSSQSAAARRRPPGRNRSDSGPTRGYDPYNKSNRQKRSEFSDPPVGGGTMGQFSLSNITTPDESPEQRDQQDQQHHSQQGYHQRPSSSQPSYPSSAPDIRRDIPPYHMNPHPKTERTGSNS